MADPTATKIAALEKQVKELTQDQKDMETRLKQAEGSIKDIWQIVTDLRKKVGT